MPSVELPNETKTETGAVGYSVEYDLVVSRSLSLFFCFTVLHLSRVRNRTKACTGGFLVAAALILVLALVRIPIDFVVVSMFLFFFQFLLLNLVLRLAFFLVYVLHLFGSSLYFR